MLKFKLAIDGTAKKLTPFFLKKEIILLLSDIQSINRSQKLMTFALFESKTDPVAV